MTINAEQAAKLIDECSEDLRALCADLEMEEWLREQKRKALEISERLNKQRAEWEAKNPGNYLTLGDVDELEGQSEASKLTGWTGE